MKKLRIQFLRLGRALIDDKKSGNIFCISTYSILGLIALIMTVINVFTHKGFLTASTGVFAFLCLINLLLTLKGESGRNITLTLFPIEMIALFTYFLISGNPEGFSAIWICLLPSLGLLFFGRKRGSVLSAVMFLILVFLLWIPFGKSLLQYEYTNSFCMRFPVLYLSFYILSLFLESLRVTTANEMKRLQVLYRELSIKDSLTGVMNRQGMYSAIEENPKYRDAETLGVAMFDIDFFKEVNDTYGHNAGDLVLKTFSQIITDNLDALICRWGGEEFVAIYVNGSVTMKDLQHVKDLVQEAQFESEGRKFSITTSAGYFETAFFSLDNLDRMIDKADAALYEAKHNGRNRIVRFDPDRTNNVESARP